MLPDTRPIFVIGDIHGCFEELKELIDLLPLTADSILLFLGDYIDRGENSKQVIEYILELKTKYKVIPLMGNHEEMFLHYFQNLNTHKAVSFLYNGGGQTLASYGNPDGTYTIPDEHKNFIRSLYLFRENSSYFFAHSGAPEIPLTQISLPKHQEPLLWSRNNFLNSTYQWEKIVIHGHSCVENVQFRNNRINLDTGCVFGNKLSALQLPEKKLYSVQKKKPTRHIYLKNSRDEKRVTIRFDTTIPVKVEHEGRSYAFDTINYSEFGMFIFDGRHPSFIDFQSGSEIKGEIGEFEPVKFAGRILRADKKFGVHYYAIQFTLTPFESGMQELSS